MIHYVLIRHGETLWTKERRYQGASDTSLTPKGRKQMQRFVRAIVRFRPDAVFSSRLRRSLESAKIVCRPLRKKPKVDARLNELGFGAWEGKTADELLCANEPSYLQWSKGKITTPKGGESIPSLRKRIKSFIGYCQKNYDNKKIIIITHGGPIRMFLRELLKLDNRHLSQFRIDPGTMTVIGKYRYSTQLILLNSAKPPKEIIPHGCV